MASRAIHEVVSAPGGKAGAARYGLAGRRRHLILTSVDGDVGAFSVRKVDALLAAVETSRAAATA